MRALFFCLVVVEPATDLLFVLFAITGGGSSSVLSKSGVRDIWRVMFFSDSRSGHGEDWEDLEIVREFSLRV